ncbi:MULTISPECIES: DeoR/GlpR family DNA-binding transcription regulator [unclassified Rothia (in: high G+C Gram-positive bacteria)]|uniref:DeoR/GlpR family DNA-binding transcription regulator n=1 Tax=unclassified Rothia (in: high G+C Gram-positive bacteria) TaxID=2689056 RepID=UPI001957FE3D|nr:MULTISPECIES: DeoR/GlpR family DNA-binding transcription regulator [unclassified Rothia (in: high G+C Gram-positive bacteria)]MBM7052052.1 DeoR/GlpR transcriptional regulator [Rothia sp. ZJ1223]QRZ61893.1 DeoR/GlpR transcriptional regulator [Rothia sp. ZJ932]
MFAEERRAEIAKLVSSARRVNGADLARRYEVTMETVRRDLAALEAEGKLRRVHGGAVTVEQSTSVESSIALRQSMNTPEKQRIAQKAYDLLRDSDVGAVVLDAGTTIEILADRIATENFSLKSGSDRLIITHALHIAVKLAEADGIVLDLVGGQLRRMTWAAVGARAAEHFSTIRPDIAVIGVNGLDAEFGLSTPGLNEAIVKTAIVKSARRVVLLCDSAKFGQESLVRFAAFDDIDTLITDKEPEGELASALEESNVEVLIA